MKRAPRSGGVFGRYLLLEQLGQGDLAQLWLARRTGKEPDPGPVVVKTLHPRLWGQPLFAELFAAEARITRLLSHPGIVRVVDHGVVKGTPYLAMERVDGWDLATLCRALPAGRRAPVEVVQSIGIELCRAVGYAHDWCDERGTQRPIVHGDLSPSHVMVRRDGGVTLLDFGVAHMSPRVAGGRAHLVIGKSGYLAPELLDDAAADARSDVFSAGVMLHELLTGRHLFAVESERETLRRLSEATVAPPSESNPEVTPELDEIVLRALRRDPSRRFASANELAVALERVDVPRRGTRARVARFVGPLLAGAQRRDQRRSAARPRALPSRPVAALAAHPVQRRRTRSSTARWMLALAVVTVAMLAPLPRAPAGWELLIAAHLPAPSPSVPAADRPKAGASR